MDRNKTRTACFEWLVPLLHTRRRLMGKETFKGWWEVSKHASVFCKMTDKSFFFFSKVHQGLLNVMFFFMLFSLQSVATLFFKKIWLLLTPMHTLPWLSPSENRELHFVLIFYFFFFLYLLSHISETEDTSFSKLCTLFILVSFKPVE